MSPICQACQQNRPPLPRDAHSALHKAPPQFNAGVKRDQIAWVIMASHVQEAGSFRNGRFYKPYFRVRLATESRGFGPGQPVIPGMIAQVDIILGQHTIMSYVTNPINRMASEALRQ